jgi:hypothetical protein
MSCQDECLQHPQFVDMTGRKFGRLLILGLGEKRGSRLLWRVRCDCGTEKQSGGGDIRSGKIISCGCWKREKARAAGDRTRTHGMSGTSTHNIWDTMIQRCHNPNRKDYQRYGGIGITVCDRWRNSFEHFLADMGERPTGLSIDRRDGTKGYSPDNCRWATNVEQARNSKSARLVTIAGKTKCVTEWLVDIGLSDTAYQSRRHRGWDDARALTTPPDQRFNWHKRSRT